MEDAAAPATAMQTLGKLMGATSSLGGVMGGTASERDSMTSLPGMKKTTTAMSQSSQATRAPHDIDTMSPLSNADSQATADISPGNPWPMSVSASTPKVFLPAPIAEEEGDETPSAPPPGLDAKNASSPGAALHGSGHCRPCAWFHKAQGCENGDACRHCHLCPQGEIKNRKKMKADSMRHEKAEKSTKAEGAEAPPSPRTPAKVALPAKVMLPLPGKSASALELPPPPGLPEPASPSAEAAEGLPSLGSAAHGGGQCKPCAWFYKSQGCGNDKDCRHCHLCPEGEIRSRRKLKVAALRKPGDDDASPASGTHADHAALLMRAQQLQHAAMLSAHWGAQALWEAAQWEAAGEAMAAAAACDSGMPSMGSTLHPLGKCRPCAWFWKAQGCLNGKACAHCHLCPEGELRERKRIKESAMRIGALLPASASPSTPMSRSTTGGRSPHVVKIAPILGA